MKIIYSLLLTCLSFTLYSQVNDSLSWPIEITSEKGYITTLYQPQLESFKGNILEGRMAVTLKPESKDLIFGAVWFKARLSTDLEKRIAVLVNIDIVKTHFPEMVDEKIIDKFSNYLKGQIESWDLKMSIDRLTASLEEVDDLKELSVQINNEAPEVYFRTSPAVLISIDGEPKSKTDTDTKLDYVVNTPFFLVKTKNKQYYIKGGDFWYTSEAWSQGWSQTNKVPNNVKKFASKNKSESSLDSVTKDLDKAPELIITTKPAELIIVDGEMDYKPIESTTLLYVSNSESDIIMDINSQNHYILLAGRWYSSKTLKDGDWKFCEPKNLPKDFANIPDNSEMASVRVSVPSTNEAKTALLEQSIPQTATIDRKTASVTVSYDGDPKFEKVSNTYVLYALNSDKTVLLIKNNYYCVDDAVWFISNSAQGPWVVSDEKPSEVDQLPPDAPCYNVKYTYIYESTPEVIYVGYLPGYTYSYVYGGVVVYGTGYYYRPWFGYHYYPRPVTWGYGVHYNPYSGWGFSVSYSYGWVSWGYHPYYRSYWGPYGYRSGYRHGYHRGYHNGYRRGYGAGYRAGKHHANRNVYSNRRNGVRNTGHSSYNQNRSLNNKAKPSNRANNMYADKKGNVYKRNNKGGFDNKTNTTKAGKPTQGNVKRPSPSKQPDTGGFNNNRLDRSHQSRTRGTQNYNRARQQGGARAGGMRGRR